MTEGVENLILEHLRALRGSIDRVEQKMADGVMRVGSLESQVVQLHKGVALLHEDQALLQARLDRLEARLDRIERRLDIRESA